MSRRLTAEQEYAIGLACGWINRYKTEFLTATGVGPTEIINILHKIASNSDQDEANEEI